MELTSDVSIWMFATLVNSARSSPASDRYAIALLATQPASVGTHQKADVDAAFGKQPPQNNFPADKTRPDERSFHSFRC